ncbi:MAG: M28 family peptidase [Kangiellaceae bacterium]|nr:M28 family peptidase [Kangiellaceae bacterium]
MMKTLIASTAFAIVLTACSNIKSETTDVVNNDQSKSSEPTKASQQSINPAKSNYELADEWMNYLTSDEMQGRKTGSPQMLEAQQWLIQQYQEIGIQPLPDQADYKQDFLAQTKDGELPAANILGYLPCHCDSDRFIIIGAHYDHVGTNPSLEGDQIFNGADDDASGVVTSLLIAKQLAKLQSLPFNVMIAAWDAEELGLLGSKHFVENPTLPLNQIESGFMFELVGTKGEKNTAWMTGSDYSSLFPTMQQQLAQHGWTLGKDPFAEQGLFMRSDNAPFALMDMTREKMVKVFREKQKVAMKGIPVHAISVWNGQNHYHQANDDMTVIDVENMTNLALAIAKVISDLPQDTQIKWLENSQFDFSRP